MAAGGFAGAPIMQNPSAESGCKLILVPMPGIHITDIEAAINYWRAKAPSPDGVTLAALTSWTGLLGCAALFLWACSVKR